jgi:SAM-dependent methyltransferase
MPDFVTVTETAGEAVPAEQLSRLEHRYAWAADYCRGRDVLEAACGGGLGLNYLARHARSLRAGDISPRLINDAQRLNPHIPLSCFDAQSLPFAAESLDVLLLFEALYYLPSAQRFFAEARRVLRPGGRLLIATANKDLFDFNPSPYSYRYYGTAELSRICRENGLQPQLFGHLSTADVSLRQRGLRPLKKLAVRFGLMPQTNAGKRWIKRIVFGRLVALPERIQPAPASYRPPLRLFSERPDQLHKVIYCAAVRSA